MSRLSDEERLKKFSKRLTNIVCDRMGITGHGLAETMHINKGAASNYMTGKKFPPADSLRRIADYYGVSMDWLMVRDEGNEPDYPADGMYQDKFSKPVAQSDDPDKDSHQWKSFRKRMKKCMIDRGHTYVSLSNMIYMSNQTLSAYVHGYRNPKVDTVIKLATALKVDYRWLMGWIGEDNDIYGDKW